MINEEAVQNIISSKKKLGRKYVNINECLNICYIFDHNAVRGAGVSICSICQNNENRKSLIFHALCSDLEENDIFKLERLAFQYNITIILYFIDKSAKIFHDLVIGNFPVTIWYRILLPYIINCKQILYLDSDIINLRSLKDLFFIDMEVYSLLAVPDTKQTSAKRNKALGLSVNNKYFNSGVLMMNVEMWKKHNFSNKILDVAKKYGDKLVLPDQDALNLVFAKRNDVYYLDKKYNRVALWKESNIKEKLNQTVLLHFVQTKPWQEAWLYEKRPYIENLFAQYENISPWKGTPLETKDKLSYHDKRKRAIFMFKKGNFLKSLYWYKEYLVEKLRS